MTDITMDMDWVRAEFPGLANGFVFMDNAGGSQTLKRVVNRISDYLLHSDVQLGATYEVSQAAGRRVSLAAEEMATFIKASPEEVVAGPSTSMMMKILSMTLGQKWGPGDEVIITNSDHEANISPWTSLAKDRGFEIKVWNINRDSMKLELEDLASLLNANTRLLAMTHASNILGYANPIKEAASMVHQAGALIAVDGVAYAPHRAIDVQDWDVDFYAFSYYKVYGPHYAMLYGKKALLDQLPTINHYFINEGPYKFQPGNVNFELSYGMTGMMDYCRAMTAHHISNKTPCGLRESITTAYELIATQEEKLSRRLLDFLNSKNKVQIIGPSDYTHDRVPTISFVTDGCSKAIVDAVDPHGIGIRYGDFYAVRLIEDLGLVDQNGVVRISMVHYNTLEELDRLIAVLDRII